MVRTEVAKQILDYIREKDYAEFKEAKIDIVQKLCDHKIKIHPWPPKKKEETSEE